ncbi:protein kinase family protein [Dinghuibacter silviterrae]|uniref:Uncharacterized protein n=1 Tax=Dinghuibacter silviterrae TaxID=1539049 RepID=A0A4R8DGF0_9BACT|nr:hypothetical protein [Dinghuibacter silviterrae]TDW96186.1 hypothetical protein EDB95_4010 [Dinghuibacter silviterrae]
MSIHPLEEAGFNISTPITRIETQEDDDIFYYLTDPFSPTSNEEKVDFVFTRLNVLTKLIGNDKKNGIQNPIAIGYSFAESRKVRIIDNNPTIGEVWGDLVNDGLIPGLAKLKKDKIESFVQDIAYGYSLYPKVQSLKRYKEILDQCRDYFIHSKASSYISFDRHIYLLEIFFDLGFSIGDRIRDVVDKNNLIEKMRLDFEKITTPDIKRTIEARLENINAHFGKQKRLKSSKFDNPYYQGNLIALRDQNPLLIELAETNSPIVFSSEILNTYEGFNHTPENNIKELIKQISEGYAYTHHIVYLEKKLSNITNKLSVKRQTAPEPEVKKLKWKGQKNQLYYVLRLLKNKDLIANSYEELSVFLQTNVDVFKDTSLSTITKQLARPQKLPKARRIDLDE